MLKGARFEERVFGQRYTFEILTGKGAFQFTVRGTSRGDAKRIASNYLNKCGITIQNIITDIPEV